MLQKIKSNFISLNIPSAKLMMHGVQFCCLLIIISGIVYLCNDFSSNYSYTINQLCKTTVVTATSIFAEIMIGSIILDLYAKKHNQD